jgi:galacturonosyltransferase
MLYKFRKELIYELSKENKITISLPKGEYADEFQDMGCELVDTFVDRRGVNPFTDSRLVFQYFKIIKRVNPDIIITYSIKPNIYAGLASKMLNIAYYPNITGLGTAFEGGILTKFVRLLYKQALVKAKVVFFENSDNLQIFEDYKIIGKQQAYLLNGAGVNLHEYNFADYPEETEKITFLFVGRIMKEKGVEELFQAISAVRSKYPEVQFDFLGWYEEEYRNTVELLAAQGMIHYYGFQTDVKPYIQKAHCIILPSHHEGMSNTLLESAAMGRPLIASNIFGCKEVVCDGVNGYLTNVKDSEDLSNKIVQFIELPYTDKKRMGIFSRKYIENTFDRNCVVAKTKAKLLE